MGWFMIVTSLATGLYVYNVRKQDDLRRTIRNTQKVEVEMTQVEACEVVYRGCYYTSEGKFPVVFIKNSEGKLFGLNHIDVLKMFPPESKFVMIIWRIRNEMPERIDPVYPLPLEMEKVK